MDRCLATARQRAWRTLAKVKCLLGGYLNTSLFVDKSNTCDARLRLVKPYSGPGVTLRTGVIFGRKLAYTEHPPPLSMGKLLISVILLVVRGYNMRCVIVHPWNTISAR